MMPKNAMYVMYAISGLMIGLGYGDIKRKHVP
jgi:hypothetical protein